MLEIGAININNSSLLTQSLTKSEKTELNKDIFLKLLSPELSNQNPLEPMDNQEFVAQMAQFTALEQSQQSNHCHRPQRETPDRGCSPRQAIRRSGPAAAT